jgi:serine/threonine-protein kinase RsbW
MREATTAPLLVWSRAFPAVPARVREAREFLSAILNGCSAADDAVLCVSELAANAIVHSRSREPGGQFLVRVRRHRDDLRVEVTDQGGPWAQPADSGPHNGRGLLIVDRLTRSWGRAGDDRSGWTVWFEMECW